MNKGMAIAIALMLVGIKFQLVSMILESDAIQIISDVGWNLGFVLFIYAAYDKKS